jgi:membrane-associated phospholipid phosphatase
LHLRAETAFRLTVIRVERCMLKAAFPSASRRDLPVRSSGYPAPVLDMQRDSSASLITSRLRRSPIAVFCLVTLVGYLVVAAVTIGIGLLLVDVLLPVHSIGHADELANGWLARHRGSSLNDASYVGSSIGDIPAVPALVILTAAGAVIRHRWRIFAFIVGAILIEVATYRVTSLIVHRERPTVLRLDHLPVNQSFPSGHVAASVVVYGGLALLACSRLRERWARMLVWTIAILLPVAVAVSRMYRGMHHPIDVTAGALVGAASLAVALLATRAADGAAPFRSSTGKGAHR